MLELPPIPAALVRPGDHIAGRPVTAVRHTAGAVLISFDRRRGDFGLARAPQDYVKVHRDLSAATHGGCR